MFGFHRFPAVMAAASLVAMPMAAQQTVPERTNGARTSSHAEVLAFIDSLTARGAKMHVATLGSSPQGKRLPYVVVSRPLVTTPAAAKATGKPLFYIQGNIHAGEVEGKEAVQALMRDLTLGSLKPLLDSVIIIFVPIYNADGNDAWGPNEVNRSAQLGPALVGLRPNGQGYDLNRDYVKQEAPETRASLALIRSWDPDVFMDLHTTDGSYHGYALTWSPGLNPNRTPLNDWVQDTLLESVRKRVRDRHGFETYPYGNFDGGNTTPTGWRTYEPFARYGSNIEGMTRLSILSEAMSHDPLPRRIASTYAFVLESVRYVNEHKADVRKRLAATIAQRPDSVVVRSSSLDASPARMDSVLVAVTRSVEVPASERADSAARANAVRSPAIRDTVGCFIPLATGGQTGRGGNPGRGAGGQRGAGGPVMRTELTGQAKNVWMEVRDRFSGARKEAIPAAYIFDASYTPVVERLRRQGVVVQRVSARWVGQTSRFMVDSLSFGRNGDSQGHTCSPRFDGHWAAAGSDTVAAQSYLVATNQRFGMLAAYLLEPMSEDGYTFWNFFDRGLKSNAPAPVRRLLTIPATLKRTVVP